MCYDYVDKGMLLRFLLEEKCRLMMDSESLHDHLLLSSK
jgi:hypothetical protein